MYIKLNNKGFTLIELLAVILILVSISFVAVGGISNSLQKRESKECKEQQELAISAAKIYFSLDGKGISEVTIATLKSRGYIKDDDSKVYLLKDTDKVKFSNTGYLYKYSDESPPLYNLSYVFAIISISENISPSKINFLKWTNIILKNASVLADLDNNIFSLYVFNSALSSLSFK